MKIWSLLKFRRNFCETNAFIWFVIMWSAIFLLVLVPVDSIEFRNVAQRFISYPCTDQNHLVLIPGALTAGSTNRACVSRFHADGPARLLLTLTINGNDTTAARDLSPGDGGCLDLPVPMLPNTKAELIINIGYPEARCTWERRLTVRISSGRLVVLQTERARYRPGDTIRARVLMLKADLAPVHGNIDEIWLEGPPGAWAGTRADQWLRVRTRLGIAQVQHALDAQAPPGRWTLRARLEDGSQGSSQFWVGNYEIPPFQLSVRHAGRVWRSSERLVWIVCVRYPWTEAVEGMLVIRLRGAGGNFDTDQTPGVRTAVRLRAPKACHRHAIAARRVGLNGDNPPDVVVADFSFQEEGTRIWQNTTVMSQVVDKAITLEFLTKHRAVVAPGLPYKLKVKATRWDDKPAANERVLVCRAPADRPGAPSCDNAVTDDKGVARVMFTAEDDSSVLYNFQATLLNDNSTAAPPLFLPVRHTGSTHAALGPLRSDANAARSFVPLYLSNKEIDTALTVHFVVITRGGIIYRWGATTQCPTASSANQIYTAPRNSRCPQANLVDHNTQGNSSDLLDRHMLRVMLPIKVTHQMCPDSQLIAYFYYRGELVSASKQIEMEECFANKVNVTWLSRQVAPGDSVALSLTTHGLSLCGLSVVDSASHWLDPAASPKDAIMERLKNLMDGHRNLTEYDAAGECFLTSDTTEAPYSSVELLQAGLAAAGVRAAGGGGAGGAGRRCGRPRPAPLRRGEGAPRTDFSEAWLWRLVAVGPNGSVVTSARAPDSITRFEASALCVSRNGVAMSAPASLQVFREFFIHADSPKRLTRGDTTILQYRIFNYLYESLNIEIQVLADPHLQVPLDRVEVASIAARASVARRVTLHAALPGAARLALRARAPDRGVSDEIIIQIQIDPEGVPAQDYQSALLCGTETSDPLSRTSQVSWSWPKVDAVPGSETVTVWAIGDITGPLLADADSLVLLPRGCGEQNMARLATNLLALKQLDPRTTAATSAKEHVARGIIRQIQYAHPSGGFSAFGAADEPSTWLTAFVVRYLKKAHEVVSPGMPPPLALRQAERWLMNQQMENGCFRNEGQVFHRELKGGLNEDGEIANVALTAYVITSLVEGASDFPYKVLKNTLSCLRALAPLKSKSPTRVYAHAVLAYAFMRLRRFEEELRKSNEASPLKNDERLEEDEDLNQLLELMRIARRNGEYVWWETSSLATSIEATGYALLALTSCPAGLSTSCAGVARGATRWLSAQRQASGGFQATQDTLVALEALTSWAASQPTLPTNLNVTARSGGTVARALLTPHVKVPELMKMAVGNLDVVVEGSGCALIQATRAYHTQTPAPGDKVLSVQVSVRTDGTFNCEANNTSCFCAAIIEACVLWSGEFPEMALLDIALPGGFGADASLLYSQLQQPDTLLRRIELSPSASRATLYLATRGSIALHGAHRCFVVHAVGPAAATKPAYVRLQDYYVAAHNDTQVYTIPEDCPSRISHRTDDYLRSDNLFSKAKSQDSDKILITDDFSFEDVPDGIPLDDPVYENLTQIDDKKFDKGELMNEKRAGNLRKKNTLNEATSVPPDTVENTVTTTENDVRPATLELENTVTTGTEENTPTTKDDDRPAVLESKNTVTTDTVQNKTTTEDDVRPAVLESKNTVTTDTVQNTTTTNDDDRPAVLESKNTVTTDTVQNTTTTEDDVRPVVLESENTVITGSVQNTTTTEDDVRPAVLEWENTVTTGTVENMPTTEDDVRPENFESENEITFDKIMTHDKMERDIDTAEDEIYDQQEVAAPDIESEPIENTKNTKVEIPQLHIRENITDELQKPKEPAEYTKTTKIEDEITRMYIDLNPVENKNAKLEIDDHKIVTKDDVEKQGTGVETVDNPKLSSFHVIDSAQDLDVPTGIEGPVPAVVLPPPNFVSMLRAPVRAALPTARPSFQRNLKKLFSYPRDTYYIYTEMPIPRSRYRHGFTYGIH